FAPSAPQRAVDPRPTPRRGDLDGDHVPDLVTLNDAGEILFRRGLPGGENRFEPPVIVNPDRSVRDFTLVATADGLAVAGSDAEADTVSVYRFAGRSALTPFARVAVVNAGRLPQRVAAADLDGDGLDDLVIANTLGDSVTVAFQQAGAAFTDTRTVP